MYCPFCGVTVDKEFLSRKAAEQGDASAQFNLGYSHSVGLGVAQDGGFGTMYLSRD